MPINPKPKPAPVPKGKRKQSKSERKQLEKLLWDITADIVKRRDGRCVTCGTQSQPTMSHYYKCGKQKIRYDLRNVHCMCAPCNNRHNYYPQYYEDFMIKTYSPAELGYLRRDSMIDHWKWKVTELRDMLASRRAMWKEMTGEEWQPHKR